MSNRIELTLSPSVSAGLLAIIPWLGLAVFTVSAALEASYLLLLLALPILALGWASFLRYGLLRKPDAIVAISHDHAGLTCRLANGRHVPATVSNASFFSSRLLVLQFKPRVPESSPMLAIITGSHAGLRSNVNDPTAFRRLRMLLRAGSPEAGHNTPSH
ncbi:hypothetical protein [Marinobacter litoralis]|uniref:hypothetical protein n=1 Tax=Marinobacter litoralis TaxID=187981 RepID=UPI0010589980|nr:hypothetical protein [Marinobacter litoralis]